MAEISHELSEIAWCAFRDSNKPAPYNQVRDALVAYEDAKSVAIEAAAEKALERLEAIASYQPRPNMKRELRELTSLLRSALTHPAPSETGASVGVKAQITPFSSVVGQSVLLLDDDGAALAHLSISIPNPDKPYRETAEEVARIIELAINQPPSEEVKKLRVRLADLMAADAKRMAGR